GGCPALFRRKFSGFADSSAKLYIPRLPRLAKITLIRAYYFVRVEIMPIRIPCDCGKKILVKEELAGKKVRCPGCKAVLVVPTPADDEELDPDSRDSEEEPSARFSDKPTKSKKGRAREEDFDQEESEEEERPRKKKKKKPQKSNNVLLFSLLG